MTPNLHPRLVNGRFGDPALFVGMRHRRDALLFDLGDLAGLSARDLLRVSHVFVSHMHIDHFIGFDALLRVSVGRERVIRMVGPPGFTDAVEHKLQAYSWDLVERYSAELVFEAREVRADGSQPGARFRFLARFAREELAMRPGGPVAEGDGFAVRAATLDHHGPCIGYAVAEPAHVNVWKNRLAERGLATGPWLQALKKAVLEGRPDSHPVPQPGGGTAPLATLRDLVTIGQGQKIAYVTDVADTDRNRAAIAALAAEADLFFLEARFASADTAQARDRAHLTTRAAGEIARRARVRRLEPFHFSQRYEEEGEARMLAEAAAAFAGA
jgi:ribonuclease Z